MSNETQTSNIASDTHYGRIARLYEWGAYWGSGGQIQESKKFHLSLLKEPKKILYPGVGWGREVVLAVKQGHQATIVELDIEMLNKAKSVLEEAGVLDQVECIHGSILDHHQSGQYDVVVASYLLDVFSPDVMRQVYQHLVDQLKPGGMLALSGYAPLNGSFLHRILQKLNHTYANLFCKLVVNNATHDIYNYEEYFSEYGLKQITQKDFKHFGSFGPRFHRFWAAEKTESA